MKTCLIQQPSGLGDIMLSIKIANHYKKAGYKIIWPVFSVYSNLNEKLKTDGITFIDMNSKYELKQIYQYLSSCKLKEVTEYNNVLFVPIKNSFHSSWGKSMQRFDSHDASNMLAKFLMCGTTHDNWQDHFEIIRDRERENSLIEHLNISKDFHLVNKMFGTPPTWKEVLDKDIITPDNLVRVDMDYVDGYNVFDWIGVYERASKIDTVSTSTFYFFEKLDLNCVPTIYSRNTSHRSHEENFSWLQRLAKKEYNFIC